MSNWTIKAIENTNTNTNKKIKNFDMKLQSLSKKKYYCTSETCNHITHPAWRLEIDLSCEEIEQLASQFGLVAECEYIVENNICDCYYDITITQTTNHSQQRC